MKSSSFFTTLFLAVILVQTALAAQLGVTISQLSGDLEAQYILESNPDRDALSINVSARIQRSQPAQAANVTVRWRATLSVAGGGAQIAQTSHTTQHLVNGVHNEVVNTSFELDPPQLMDDTVNHTLLLEVFHIEDPQQIGGALTLDDTQPLTYLNFGHFSGVLNFGGINTTLTHLEDINGNPLPPHYQGNSQWDITHLTGLLSGGTTFSNTDNSSPSIIATRDPLTGDLTVDSGNAEVDDGDGTFNINGWKGRRGVVLISTTGIAAADFKLTLPPGLGWRAGTSGSLRGEFNSAPVPLPLNESLTPNFASLGGAIPVDREFIGNCLAVAFTPSTWSFDGTQLTLATPGTRFLRKDRYDQHLSVKLELPRSNDSYLYFLQASAGSPLAVLPGGISVSLQLDSGNYTTHFPEGDVGGLASTIQIENNLIDSEASDMAAAWVHLQYNKACPDSLDPDQHQGMRIIAPSVELTPQGGLWAQGELASHAQFAGVERHLDIGLNTNDSAVHQTDEFQEKVEFYAPGFCAPPGDHPGDFLHAESQPQSDYDLGYPGSSDYAAGLGLYAGFNFFYHDGMRVASQVGGSAPIDYEVSPSKAYARWSGASGIIEALPSELPFNTTIYDFKISFNEWGFNFLSNQMHESFIDGRVDLLGTPADFVQGMKDVRISCCGNLEEFEIPEGEAEKNLGYWENFKINNSSARFVTPANCDDDRACLSYSTTVKIDGLPGRKAGTLCFLNDGTMTRPTDADFERSHLVLESQQGLAGKYFFYPTDVAYFNHPSQNHAGFITAAGEVETPYFDLTPIRFHTSAVGIEAAEVEDEFITGFIHGDFLNAGQIDEDHRGIPNTQNLDQYRTSTEHRPVAQAAFFGKEGALNYPVIYNLATGNFHSPEDKGVDLLVAEFQSGIDRLNHEIAQMHFGAEINGFTQMTVGNLLEEAAEYGAQGLAQAIGDDVAGPIKEGLLGLAETLDNRLEKLLEDALDRAIDTTVVDPMVAALYEMEQDTPNWTDVDLHTKLELYLKPDGALRDAIVSLRNIEEDIENISTSIGSIESRLDKLHNSLNCLVLLLNGDIDEHAGLDALYGYLIEQLELNPDIGEIDPSVVTAGLDAVVSSANIGWLNDARDAIIKLRDAVGDARDLLASGQEFFDEIGAVFGNAAEVLNVVAEARIQIEARIISDMQGQILDFTPDEIGNIIRGSIKDQLFGSILAIDLQSILRARLGYLDSLIQDGINTALQAFTKAAIDALEQTGVLDSLNSAVETFSEAFSYLKAARINGEATTYSDRLKEATIQSEVEFGFPTPIGISIPMKADCLLKYYERVSDGDSPCNPAPGAILPEVILKASGGTAIGFGADSTISSAIKFSFEEDFTPAGFAGVFQIEQSKLNMNSMGMRDFSGTIALGGAGTTPEYYLSANAGGSFGAGGQALELEGGFFIGQTCSEHVFAFYPNFPFPPGPGESRLGVVAHLSGKCPLTGGTCFYNVTAGAEIGAYALLDGDGHLFYGGLLGGSVSGEVLCLVKAQGEISLAYGYGGGIHRFDGEASAKVRLGIKPFQIKKTKTFHVVYEKADGGEGNWDVNP